MKKLTPSAGSGTRAKRPRKSETSATGGGESAEPGQHGRELRARITSFRAGDRVDRDRLHDRRGRGNEARHDG